MKLICEVQHQSMLEQEFLPYRSLPVVFVEKGCFYDGVCINFDIEHLKDVHEVAQMMLHQQEHIMIGKLHDRMYPIPTKDIVYIEGYRREAYLHTEKASYEINYRLYEAEELLGDDMFIRINKSTIVNISKIKSIMPALNACYSMEMVNGILLECSRQYWKTFKKKLGMR